MTQENQADIDTGLICKQCGKIIDEQRIGKRRKCDACYSCGFRGEDAKTRELRRIRRMWRKRQCAENKWKCPCCKEYFNRKDRKPTIDHVIPTSKGGLDIPRNWQLLCEKCNLEKGDTLVFPPPELKGRMYEGKEQHG